MGPSWESTVIERTVASVNNVPFGSAGVRVITPRVKRRATVNNSSRYRTPYIIFCIGVEVVASQGGARPYRFLLSASTLTPCDVVIRFNREFLSEFSKDNLLKSSLYPFVKLFKGHSCQGITVAHVHCSSARNIYIRPPVCESGEQKFRQTYQRMGFG